MAKSNVQECMSCWEPSDQFIECMCDWRACEPCNQQYLALHYSEPHCMNTQCKAKWTPRFMATNFSPQWYNSDKKGGYRYLTKLRLLEREKAQIPATLEMMANPNIIKEKKKVSHYQWVCPCPNPNGCNGLVDRNYECLICKAQVCKKCREIKLEEHTCKPETVATVKILKGKDTKPCPKCAAPIFKIDGCDQMFCDAPGCKTAFSWSRGTIETGVIHNPHAIAWLRKTGQQNHPRLLGNAHLGDNQDRCQLIGFGSLHIIFEQWDLAFPSKISDIYGRIGECSHLRRLLERKIVELEMNHTKNRVKYLKGQFKRRLPSSTRISEEYKKQIEIYIKKNQHKWINGKEEEHTWVLKIFSVERAIQRTQILLDIFVMLENVGIAEFWKLHDQLEEATVPKEVQTILNDFMAKIDTLADFVNESILTELKLFGKKSITPFNWDYYYKL